MDLSLDQSVDPYGLFGSHRTVQDRALANMQTMVNKSDIKSESGEAVKEDVLEEKQK